MRTFAVTMSLAPPSRTSVTSDCRATPAIFIALPAHGRNKIFIGPTLALPSASISRAHSASSCRATAVSIRGRTVHLFTHSKLHSPSAYREVGHRLPRLLKI